MRVGIYLGSIMDEQVGGGSTFQISLLRQLLINKSHHEFYFIYKSNNIDINKLSNLLAIKFNNNHKFINISHTKIYTKIRKLFRKKIKEKSYPIDINKEIINKKIDFIWLISPEYLEINCGYAFTVWDLQHRLQTYFPEVSLSGWKYEDREDFYKKMIGKSSFTIIGNREGAKQINQLYNYPLERIKIIPMPTPNYVYELTGDDKVLIKNNLFKHRYLFYPAQFWPHKNHIRLLKALKILKQKNIQFDLVFTGSDKGNLEYIKQKTKEFNLENSVKFLGFVSKKEIIALYQNAFALTYTSMFGPDNIPPLEAMALNCPVICANYNGAHEQLQNCALFFDPLNENEIVEQIINLQNNSQLRNDLQDRGTKLASQVSTKQYIESLIKILDDFQPIREMWSSDKKFIHL